MSAAESGQSSSESRQLSTFYIAGHLYGIDVTHVQEVTRAMPMTPVPLAPAYVHGLINLRGQIATAIGLRNLFSLDEDSSDERMNVICRVDGLLLALLVDRIGDVIEVQDSDFEPTPDTVAESIKCLVDGVYKIPESLLSVVSIEKVSKEIQKQHR